MSDVDVPKIDATIVTTLAEELPRQQARVREMLPIYRECGRPAFMALAIIEESLRKADEAAAAGDVVGMIRAVEDLRGYQL
jgi:bacterioferritin-associated ferredoxin